MVIVVVGYVLVLGASVYAVSFLCGRLCVDVEGRSKCVCVSTIGRFLCISQCAFALGGSAVGGQSRRVYTGDVCVSGCTVLSWGAPGEHTGELGCVPGPFASPSGHPKPGLTPSTWPGTRE